MVVGEFARFGAETQVGNRGDFDGLDVKAQSPLVLSLVLEFEFERLVLDVGEAEFGGDAGSSDTACLHIRGSVSVKRCVCLLAATNTYRAASQFIVLAIMSFVISRLPIAHHSHDVRKHCPRPVVFVGVEEDT